MKNTVIKPITGTWFSIYWHDKRHYYWNSACMSYTPEQWDALIADLKTALNMADIQKFKLITYYDCL